MKSACKPSLLQSTRRPVHSTQHISESSKISRPDDIPPYQGLIDGVIRKINFLLNGLSATESNNIISWHVASVIVIQRIKFSRAHHGRSRQQGVYFTASMYKTHTANASVEGPQKWWEAQFGFSAKMLGKTPANFKEKQQRN